MHRTSGLTPSLRTGDTFEDGLGRLVEVTNHAFRVIDGVDKIRLRLLCRDAERPRWTIDLRR